MLTTHYEGIVFYTDGAARPNPGDTGWGAHGYRYTTDYDGSKVLSSRYVTTESGYVATDKLTPLHRPVKPLEYYDLYGADEKSLTNNAAEIDAFLYTLSHLPTENIRTIQAYTDSEYLRRGVTEWLPLWARYNWRKQDGSAVSNQETWQAIAAVMERLRDQGIHLQIEWIRGHAGILGNELAHKLSVIGVMHARDRSYVSKCKVCPDKNYWKADITKHPLLSFRRLYFNSSARYNTPGHYYIAEPGCEEQYIGSKSPETAYAVIRLKTPEPVIEAVRNYQYTASHSVNTVMLLRLNKLYSRDVYPYLEEHGRYAMLSNHRQSLGVNVVDDEPLTVELRLGGLSLRAIENFGSLDELLDRYLTHTHGDATADPSMGATGFQCHDLTGVFYTPVAATKSKPATVLFKSDYPVGHRDVSVSVTVQTVTRPVPIKVALILGADLPSRNHLKTLETLQPSIVLLTWFESPYSIRYACVIETSTGVGIWSNFFANRHVLATEES
jgi:ribonuclease HI